MRQHLICYSILPHCIFELRQHLENEFEERAVVQVKTLQLEPAQLNLCITKEKKDMTWSVSSDHRSSCFYSAGFYFQILIWEFSVSDSSSLGRAGVALGFVVLSDTIFRNNSQQGGPERGLKCHGKGCNVSNLIFSVSPCFDTLKEMWAVEGYWRLLWVSSVFEKKVLRCESPDLRSNLPPISCVPLTSDEWSCEAFSNILRSIVHCLTN